MANKKITELPAATVPLNAGDILEIVQGGVNKQVAKSDVATGGGGTVTSVTGTTNRITSTGGATPVIDIDASYDAIVAAKAPIASPTFTGTPAAPTAAGGTNTTQLATTAFVQGELAGGAVAATGTAISFATRQIYGDVTPETGNVTLVTTGLIKGMTQLLVHNHSSIPTFPAEFIIIWGGYSVNVDNYIMMYAKSASVILVTISQEL